MMDYVKISLIDSDIERLLKLPFLDFKTEFSEKTGELSTKKKAEYHFCKITIHDTGAVLFTGSIHKLWNSLNNRKAPNYKPLTKEQIKKGMKDRYKGFNGNQFTLENIFEVRTHLEYLFNCKPNKMLFQNIEFGVNTTPDFNPNLYLKGLLYHKNRLFEYRFKGTYAQVEHQRYFLKIYNKSIQYGMRKYTLRIELKINKSEELKKVGIKTYADVNINTLNKAKQLLIKRFDEVVHYDYTINKKGLTKKENQLLESYSNSRFWIIDLKSNHRHRHKKRLQQITAKYSENIHQQLRADIVKKCVRINSSSIGLSITQASYSKPVKKVVVNRLLLTQEKHFQQSI